MEQKIKKITFAFVTWLYVITAFTNTLHPNRWNCAWDVFINVGGAAFIGSCVYYGAPVILNAMWNLDEK